MDKNTLFEEVKYDFMSNLSKYCDDSNFDEDTFYYSFKNFENLFDLMSTFISKEGDETSKHAIALELITGSLRCDIPFSIETFLESPIEYLLFTALQKTMPFHISLQAYLQPAIEVCGGKYRLDIGLMKRNYNGNESEGDLIIGIECDGYDTHYSNKLKATKTADRIRDIKMTENIEVFQYTGTEIFKEPINLAKQFWKYIEENVFPKFKPYNIYDSVYEMVKEYLKNAKLIENFYVYQYEHIDILELMPLSDAVLNKYRGYDNLIKAIKSKLIEGGWEGDGEIQLLWLPPFCDLAYEDTYGIITWLVNQENNGTTFICSPYELKYKCLSSQNW